MDMNATSFALLAAASVLVGIVSLWFTRSQPRSPFLHLRQGAREPGRGQWHGTTEPDVRVLFGEFFQVRQGGDDTDRAIRYEATANFRLLMANSGPGKAVSIRARATCEGMARPSWSTSGWVDLAPGAEQDVILRSMVLPPMGPEEICWVEAPLRIEYQDTLGNDWFTLARLRLKFMRTDGSDSYACWWVDVMEPQEHGMVEPAAEPVKRPVQSTPVLDATLVAQPGTSGEPLPFPSRNRGQDWVTLPVPVAASPARRPSSGDAAAAAGL